jgi:hypothetical protein
MNYITKKRISLRSVYECTCFVKIRLKLSKNIKIHHFTSNFWQKKFCPKNVIFGQSDFFRNELVLVSQVKSEECPFHIFISMVRSNP